jgi:hypothetical protein
LNNTGHKATLNHKPGMAVIHDAKGVVDMNDDIQVQSGRHTMVASGDTMTINGGTYDLRAVKAVDYWANRRYIGSGYQGTDFTISLKQDNRAGFFICSTNHHDEHIDEYRESWLRLVARIEAIAIPRLADEMAAAVRAGETVSIGPVGAKVVLSPEGVKKGGLFGKLVPWSQVIGTDLDKGTIRVWGRKAPGAAETVICGTNASGWNGRVLPHVVSRLKG